jgi:hypothetical protein
MHRMLLMLASQAMAARYPPRTSAGDPVLPSIRSEFPKFFFYGDVLRHQLGQDFILLPDLLFQFLDAPLILAALRPSGTLQRQGGIQEELFLSA